MNHETVQTMRPESRCMSSLKLLWMNFSFDLTKSLLLTALDDIKNFVWMKDFTFCPPSLTLELPLVPGLSRQEEQLQ